MCLSTVYKNQKEDNNILCQYVATITANGDELTFVDVMGDSVTITGKLLSADLTAGTVIVAAE
ncbi:MAG: CooT family nickel-binding protein [Oscillospiraceae bacterium]|nr:CooT family nickel-binding protein [Oscillospiraceae bacterium]